MALYLNVCLNIKDYKFCAFRSLNSDLSYKIMNLVRECLRVKMREKEKKK